ncbi:hypothetical protein [Fibrella forsythiae]|uniref:Uncharacterized protein n=1 Tax=Fibrella forsythiae TaxID=2817061 RepID=A0ABS3JBZ9_9BACT|nr:hypothetical protein [Fibrella forsythiae]MBO0947517.1 hypothetical protein [Fibrella forsythiae]
MGVYTELNEGPELLSHDSLSINFKSKNIQAQLNLYHFEDNGFMVSYIPSLNLSAYGETIEEAKHMLFHEVLDDFFHTIIDMPEMAVFEELGKLCWQGTRVQESRQYNNSAYVDKEGVLRDFDLPQDTPIHQELVAYNG